MFHIVLIEVKTYRLEKTSLWLEGRQFKFLDCGRGEAPHLPYLLSEGYQETWGSVVASRVKVLPKFQVSLRPLKKAAEKERQKNPTCY